MEIKDYPNYLIFRNGAVLSKGFDKWHPPRFLKHNINSSTGYYYVNLYKDKKPRPVYIHRLLGLYYIDNPSNKRCIDHIDRNKLNNSLYNLRWATDSENNYNKGMDLHYKIPTGLEDGTYTLRVYVELLKIATIENGMFSCYFA